MTVSKLKVGIAGAGVFGKYHAQKAAASGRAELAGVFDAQFERAEKLADSHGAEASVSYEALLKDVDAIVIALPATFHEDFVRRALMADKHVLVEKPLALTATGARQLAGEAITRGRVLQVGHQERFVARAMGMFRIEESPTLLESVRYSPPSPDNRAGDVSVIWDLMIHDLDLAGCLIEGKFEGVRARGSRVHSEHLDKAEAEFTYSSGAIARLKASRAATARERTMRVVYPSGEISVDFLTREVVNTTPYQIKVDISEDLPDPLGAADESFYAACLGVSNSPVPGHGAVAAVAMAEAAETIALA